MTQAYKVSNNAAGQLSADINATQTTIQLKSGEGSEWPVLGASDYTKATLVDNSGNREIVKVTARSTDVLTVERGQEGTTGRAFLMNDVVSAEKGCVPSAVDLRAIKPLP